MKHYLVFFLQNALVSILGALFYFIQISFLSKTSESYHHFFGKTYIFFYGFSLLLIIIFFLLQKIKIIKAQLGFLYLFTVFFKIGLYFYFFIGYFKLDLYSTYTVKLNLLIPFFTSLFFEVFLISKILNKTTS